MSGYTMFLNDVQMPITPGKLQLKIKGKNKTITLVNDGEVNFIKQPGLTEITVPLLLPMLQGYGGREAQSPDFYLGLFEEIITSLKPAHFILSRTSPDNRRLYDTNLKVSIESYTADEDAAANGWDVAVSLTMKLYKDFGTKTVQIVRPAPAPTTPTTLAPKATAVVEKPRETSGSPKGPHTVVAGDCLYNIAVKYYGNGAQYKKIYEANRSVIDPRNQKYNMPTYTIYPGQVLTIP